MWLKFLLLGFAIVVFVLIGLKAIDTDLIRWESFAFASAFASFLPIPENWPRR